MNYKVIRKEAFEVIGISKEFSTSDGENFQEIPKMWSNFNNSKDCEKLFNNSGKLGLLGICLDFDPENETMTYMIGVENTGELKDERFVIREINEFNYAVFDVFGKMPIAMQEASKRVYSEWFPSTNYKHAEGPEIEVYLPGDPTDDNYKSQIWIPIIKD